MKPRNNPFLRFAALHSSRIQVAVAVALGLGSLSTSLLQAGNTWTGGGSSTDWSDNNNWGGAAPAYGTLTFTTGGTQGLTSVNNSITSMNGLLWTGSSAWTLNNSGGTILSLFDNGGVQSKIENQSTGLVTINAPITFAATTGAAWGEINAVNGDLTFGIGTLTVNGTGVNGIRMFAGSGRTTTFNNTVSASGKYFVTIGANQTVAIGGAFTSGNFFLMNGGTLKLNTGGTLTTSGGSAEALRLGGDFGTTGSQNLASGATFQLTPTVGGLTTNALINTVSGNTSGALLIDSLNTSNTNILAGDFYLDSNLRVNQASGGTIIISDATTDIKGQTLTLTGTGGFVNLTGVVGNSTGSGQVVVGVDGIVGGPTVTMSLANTYTGQTFIRAGALAFTSTGSAASSTLRLGSTSGTAVDAAINLSTLTGVTTISSVINAVTTSGSGTLSINSNNTSNANTLSGQIALDRNLTINQATGGTLNVTSVHTGADITNVLGTDIKGFTLTLGGAGTIAYSGTIYNSTGSGSLVKTGAGTATLTGTNTYTGATTIGTAGLTTSGGTLAVSGASGSIATSSGILINGSGSKLSLDNTAGNVDRINNTGAVNLNLGGELSLIGNATTATSETFGSLAIGSGNQIVTIASAAGLVTTLNAGAVSNAFTRTGNGTALIRGTSLDQSAATNVSRFTLGDAGASLTFVGTNTLNNGGATNGSQALKIVPYLFGDTAVAGTGKNFVTYDTTLGLRVLNATQGATLAAGSTTAASPVNAMAFNGTVTTSGLTVNSLLFNTAAQTLSGSGALTINSGALATIVNTVAISGFSSLVLGNGEGVITTAGANALTINTPISVTASGGLTKAGAGTLNLTAANLYTGVTTLNQGTINVGNGTAAGDLGSSSGVTLNGTSALTFNRTNAYTYSTGGITGGGAAAGNTVTQAGTGALTIGNLTNVQTITRNVSTGALTLGTITGIGTLTDNSATGSTAPTTINQSGTGLTIGTITGANGSVVTLNGGLNSSTTIGTINGTSGSVVNLGGNSTSITNVTSPLNTAGQTVNFNAGTVNLNGSGAFGSTLVVNGATVNTVSSTANTINFYNLVNLQVLSGTLNVQQLNGLRIGNSAGANSANGASSATALQSGGTIKFTNSASFNLGNSATTGPFTNTFALSGGLFDSSTAGGGILIGAGASGGGITSFNFSGGTLLMNGNISGAQGTGAQQSFVWTGGTLATKTFDATNLTSTQSTPVSTSTNTLTNAGSGILAPGNVGTAGRTVITGNYSVTSANASYAVDLGSTIAATAFQSGAAFYDQTTVSGSTALGGKLNLSLINSYVPASNGTTPHSILVGSASGVTGTFTNQQTAASGNSRVVFADGLSSMLVAINNTATAATTGGLTNVGVRTVAVGNYQTGNTYTAASGNNWDAANAASWTNFDPGSSTGASGAIAQFADGAGTGTGANAVTLNSARNIQGVQFASTVAGHNYTIGATAGGVITLDNTANNASATIADTSASGTANAINVPITLNSNLAVSVTNAANALTLGGAIGETLVGSTLTKTGLGTLTLSGANTYSGGTIVNAGTLKAGVAASAFGSNQGALTVNTGGTVDFNDNGQQIGFLTGTGGTVFNNSSILVKNLNLFGNTGSGNYFGVIADNTSGTGKILVNKAGSAAQTFSGLNTYTGGTSVSSGTLTAGIAQSGASGAFGNNAPVIMGTGGGTLNLASFNESIGSLTGGSGSFGNVTLGTATLTVGGDNTIPAAYAGIISGTGGSLTKVGSTGTLNLAGVNTYTGNTTVSAGTLTISGTGTIYSSLGTGTATVSVASTAQILLSGAATNNALGFGTNETWAVSGTINSTGGSAQTLPKNVTLNNGTLSGIASTGGNAAYGTYFVNDALTTITANGASNIINAANMGMATSLTLATPLSSDALSVSSAIGVTGNLVGGVTKTGLGTVTLSGANSYTGTTLVNLGTLQYGVSNAISTGAVTLNGGTLDMVAFTDSVGAFTLTSGTLKMAANQTSNAQLVSTGVATLGTTNTLDLTGMSTTAGLYKLVSGSSVTGIFQTVNGLNSNYLLRYGTVNANELDAQRKADQSFSVTTPTGTPRALVSTNVALNGTLTNTSPTGSSALAVALSSTGTLTVGSLASSTGSTVVVGTPSTVTGSIATGATAGTFGWNVSNTDANAITSPVNISGNINVVNQRSFSVGTTPINLGRFLITGATPAGTTAITSAGLNASTANASLGSFSGVSGLALTTVDPTAFNGGAASQTANYTVGGTASSAGAISGNFSSAVTAELGSIAPVTVAVTGNALNQRSFSVGTTPINLGRFLITGATPAGTTAITSAGLNAFTANASLGNFSGVSGLSLTTGNSTTFNGAATLQTANYTVGGTASSAGAISGTFSSAVTAELGSIANVNVAVTGNALNQRTFSNPGTVDFGRVLMGASLNSGTVNVTTSGLHADTADSTLSASTSGTINGLTLSGAATLADGSSSPFNIGRTVIGTLSGTAGTLTGTFNMNATNEFSTTTTNAASVSYTVNGVATRTVNAPTSTALGTYHAGAAVSVSSNAFGYSYGAGGDGSHANTEDTNVLAYGGAADANGITLSGGANAVSTAGPFTRTFTGTAAVNTSSGSFSSTVNPEFSSATTVSTAYTIGVYSGQMVWGSGSGSGTYATGSNWTDSVAGGAQVAPGLDAGFTGVDTATFNGTGGMVSLAASSPNLNALTFANNGSYSLTTTGGTIILAGTTPSITTTGTHDISAPVTLGADTAVTTNASSQLTVSGAIGETGAAKALTFSGSGNTILSGVNTYTGTTTISGGQLTIDDGFIATSSNIVNNAALEYKLNANARTYANVISGSGSLTKSGTNSLTLTGTNTYTGPTSIIGGILAINGDQSAATGNVTVSNTGTVLSGFGTIGGNVTIQSGAIHAPGIGVGTQTIASLTYNQGSIFEWGLGVGTALKDSTDGTRGTNYDAVNVSGALATTGTGAIFRVLLGDADNFAATFWNTDHEWTNIFQTSGGGGPVGFDTIFGGGFQYFASSGDIGNTNTTGRSFTINGSTLNWSAVPEPTSALAGLLLGAGLLRRRRSA